MGVPYINQESERVGMWKLKEEMYRIALLNKIKVSVLDKPNTDLILSKTLNKFCEPRRYKYPMWQCLKNFASHRDPDGWQLIGNFVGNNKAILFFEWEDEKGMFCFEQGNDIPTILGEMFGFVFYIVDPEYHYLLCYNDHDYLIGTGTAKNWLIGLNRYN